MQQHDIHQFLVRYFKENDCEVVADEHSIVIKLTEKMDKLLMNRPFYWHYIEKIGGIPEPMTLTLVTKKNEKTSGEFVHLGSPRLHQIFQAAKKTSQFIRMYENVEGENSAYLSLIPWLNVNVKISYICDRKKDSLLSLGLHLITGQLKENFFNQLQEKSLAPTLPDYSFPMTPLIKPKSGMNRVKKAIYAYIENGDDEWAENAKARWKEDLALLEQFYEDKEKNEAYHNEKEALQIQYEPKIKVEVINGGIYYLSQ